MSIIVKCERGAVRKEAPIRFRGHPIFPLSLQRNGGQAREK